MPVLAADLREQHQALRAELSAAFERVLDSTRFIGGNEVESFENEFAAYCGASYAVGVANGTDALWLALRALDIGPGDAVAIPAFTFAATIEAVYHSGARPVLVDIDAPTFNLDPQALRDALAKSTLPVRAVIPVHLYGQMAAMHDIAAVAGPNVAVIEDAAQAHGATYRGRRAGSIGTLACFSFYPTKNLGALGDAGALTTSDPALLARLQSLRDHGQGAKYKHERVGFNSRLDAIQAAALRVKLPHLEAWNDRRRVLAQRYRRGLAGAASITLPSVAAGCEPVYHLFILRCRDRAGLQEFLRQRDIHTSVHYPAALHEHPAYAHLGYRPGDLPRAEAAGREVLALPLYPELSEDAVDTVCEAVQVWCRTA